MQQLFAALADPTRREILKLLRSGSRTAGQLASEFALTKGSLSHHFRLLREAGLVRCEKRGRVRVYSLNASVVEEIAALVLEALGAGKKGGSRRVEKDIPRTVLGLDRGARRARSRPA